MQVSSNDPNDPNDQSAATRDDDAPPALIDPNNHSSIVGTGMITGQWVCGVEPESTSKPESEKE